ncbi:MAG TPA: hypothetical protein PKD63_06525 [Solirubrobacteraceae bacterium]|nr:hypothetical protein [Solirubrobacteraceae bacterium]
MRQPGTISANNSTSPKTVTATCPAGKVAVGGGHTIDTSNTTSLAAATSQAASNTQWTVTVVETFNTNSNWTVTASVICIDQ